MEDLAHRSGGLTMTVLNGSDLSTAAGKISQAIRNEYLLGYYSEASDQPGKWHRIQIHPDLPKVHVAARGGYYTR
jgi:hypothetical protein